MDIPLLFLRSITGSFSKTVLFRGKRSVKVFVYNAADQLNGLVKSLFLRSIVRTT